MDFNFWIVRPPSVIAWLKNTIQILEFRIEFFLNKMISYGPRTIIVRTVEYHFHEKEFISELQYDTRTFQLQ